ncbi:chondrolectin isoform X2 [Thunnus albacares]|uniref:chondrolectin isoform X2 n=1 Tax=Thunnus albacares TaxID=8236 RepID=UPI001CF6F816|nr:chondrolectin isoform X2 [Thunnus albacares]
MKEEVTSGAVCRGVDHRGGGGESEREFICRQKHQRGKEVNEEETWRRGAGLHAEENTSSPLSLKIKTSRIYFFFCVAEKPPKTMTCHPVTLWILGVVMVMMVAGGNGARVVSGQTVCSGGPQRPCYKIAYFHDMSSRVAFKEARQVCEMDGGSLLSIESPAEQRDIENLLQELRSGAVGGAGGGTGGGIADGDFWIGLTRVDGVDQNHPELSNTLTSCPQLYHWTDGSPASFRNWYFDEPSCGGEACVVMYHQPTALPGLGGAYLYQWNDDSCNMKHNFICKYEPESKSVTEEGNTPEATAGGGVKQSAGSEEVPPQVTMAGASGTETHPVTSDLGLNPQPASCLSASVSVCLSAGMLLVYVIIPTIPLLLLILVASGTCCFQMFSRR